VFLADERATTFLAAIINQAARLLDAECRDINQQQQSDHPPTVVSTNRTMTQAEQNARIASLREWLELLRAGILSGTISETPTVTSLADPSDVCAIPPRQPVEETTDDLTTRGCPVCDYVAQSLFNFYSHFQYRLESEASAQKLFAEDLGFCSLHTWHLSTISSPLGLSAGYPALIQRLATELSALAIEARGSPSAVGRLLVHTKTCRACRVASDAEEKYLQRTVELLQGPAYRELYAQSQGVCLRHLAMLLEASPKQEIRCFLLSEAACHYQEMAEDMLSFVIKWEARRRALMNQDEQDAHVRALTHLAGHRYLATATRPDMEL
jgi:hypothetical protein